MTIQTSAQLSYFLSTELDEDKRLPFDALATLLGFKSQTLAAMVTYKDYDLTRFMEQHDINKHDFACGVNSSTTWSLIRFFGVFDSNQRGTVRESYLATISSGQFTASWRAALRNPRPKVTIDDLDEPFGDYYSEKDELQDAKELITDLYDKIGDLALELRNTKEQLEMAREKLSAVSQSNEIANAYQNLGIIFDEITLRDESVPKEKLNTTIDLDLDKLEDEGVLTWLYE